MDVWVQDGTGYQVDQVDIVGCSLMKFQLPEQVLKCEAAPPLHGPGCGPCGPPPLHMPGCGAWGPGCAGGPGCPGGPGTKVVKRR